MFGEETACRGRVKSWLNRGTAFHSLAKNVGAAYRQRDVKNGSMRRSVRCPKSTAMRLYNRTANRQSHPHASGFGREECVEDAVHILRVNAGAAVLYQNRYVARLKGLRFHRQQAWASDNRAHRFESIIDQVEQNLL